MPIYEYRCKDNDHTFEYWQKFTDEPLERCIKCDSEVEKLVSLSSFHLKGGGWYITDYKKSLDRKKDNDDTVKKTDEKVVSSGECSPVATKETTTAKAIPAAKTDNC